MEQTHVRFLNREQCKKAIKILRPRYIQLFGKDIDYKIRKGKRLMNKELIKVTREESFEASHLLPNYNGKCRNLHRTFLSY